MKQRIWIFIFSIILCVILTGCIKKDERGKKQKVVYVVCRRSVIPVQLGKLIDEQKREAFHREFSADRTHIYIDTILTGVTKEHQKHGKSYPYIVLKSQFYEKNVIFH